MKSIFWISLFEILSCLCFCADLKPLKVEVGAVLGTNYVSKITREIISDQPKWNPLLKTPIPLAIDRACTIALGYANRTWNFHTVRDPDLGQWEVNSVSLNRVDKDDWIYVVEILQRGPILGIRLPMRIVVLLDGFTIQPSPNGRIFQQDHAVKDNK
jgi:hypothetical protein